MTKDVIESLDAALAGASALVAEWQGKVDSIKEQIASAQHAVSDCERRRADLALGAATGDAKAVAGMKKVHADADVAQRRLTDLNLALGPAQHALAAAEKEERRLKIATRREARRGVAQRRVAVATRYDAAAREFQAAAEEFLRLGSEMQEHYIDEMSDRNMQNMSIGTMEGLMGTNRLMAAMPPFIRKIFYMAPFPLALSLEQSERSFWNFPADGDAPKN